MSFTFENNLSVTVKISDQALAELQAVKAMDGSALSDADYAAQFCMAMLQPGKKVQVANRKMELIRKIQAADAGALLAFESVSASLELARNPVAQN
jgi:hypothetical protein